MESEEEDASSPMMIEKVVVEKCRAVMEAAASSLRAADADAAHRRDDESEPVQQQAENEDSNCSALADRKDEYNAGKFPKMATKSSQELGSLCERVPKRQSGGGVAVLYDEEEAREGEASTCTAATPNGRTRARQRRATLPGAERVSGIDGRDDDITTPAVGPAASVNYDSLVGGESSAADQEEAGPSQALPIAREVPRGGDESLLPSTVAVRYVEPDPDAKSTSYCSYNRRFNCLYAVLFILVAAVVVAGVWIGATLGKKKGDYTEGAVNNVPGGIRDQIEHVVGSRVLADPNSPYAKALNWIMVDDPMQLTPESPNLIQRYISAYYYYSTTKSGPWMSCNPPDDPWTGNTSCTMMRKIDPESTFKYIPAQAWLSNVTECQFAGIKCDELGQIRTIDNSGFGLSGPFPVGIYNWPSLKVVRFSNNRLRGRLPTALVEKMPRMNILRLDHNKFSGTVPVQWWKARHLQVLILAFNQLTGSIPREVGNLSGVKILSLSSNRLTGVLPSEIGMQKSLSFLGLSKNQLNGKIPTSIGNCSGLVALRLSMNQLSGTLSPPAIGSLKQLNELKLHTNPLLSGHLPESIYGLTNLLVLDLLNCGFSGTLSTRIGDLGASLRVLSLSRNKFHGRVPTELAKLRKLEQLHLDGNGFTGSVPPGSCAALQNAASDFSADCAPDSITGYVELSCPCCSLCCEPDGSPCHPNT